MSEKRDARKKAKAKKTAKQMADPDISMKDWRRKKKKFEKTVDQIYPGDGASKMPDGYNMKKPAEKLGYIQKLGAGRMSPGKMGDMTAMKMMHGDAAAKYYDGAGMYMNGAPKYEGASKSYMGAMKHVAGHEEPGDDRPSYVKQTTTTSVVPGTQSSTSTTTSGGGSQSQAKKSTGVSYKEAYKKADKKKYPTLESFTKAAKEYNKGRSTSSSGGDTSSKSTTKKSTKPTVKTEVKKEKITSKRKSGSEVMAEGRETEMNRMARHRAGRAEKMNIAKADSARVAQQRLKGRKLTEKSLTSAVRAGNIAGAKTLMGYGSDKGSFGEKGKGRAGEFSYTREEAREAFPTDIGKATATSMGGRAKGRGKVPAGEQFGLRSSNYVGSDIGKVKDFSKKGQYKITDVKTDAGTAGSYGGYSSAKEYMDALNKGGTPKMPKGPMKFGMKK